jgi:hypothetical protein
MSTWSIGQIRAGVYHYNAIWQEMRCQKSEALNSKSETISNFKIQMTETAIAGWDVVRHFEFWLFEFD